MSKVTSSNYPSYTGGNVTVGGSNATTGVSNGTINAAYNMSNDQAAIYNYALKTLANILPSVNTFDANTVGSLQSQVDAYKNSGIADINNEYNSDLKNIENDAVSRFGNLDNSIFTDNLGKLETERSKAVSSFAQDTLARQSELESDELTKRYNLINLLSGVSDDIYSNALKTISTALTGSSNASDYSTALYNALSNNTTSNINSSNKTLAILAGALGSSGTLGNLGSMGSLATFL